ncbi:hypothetical protein [Pararhodonellum marinum]|uniref:hypothetical protein n=1 Tax=Pararhodonellum marinum TaxID=2755358 RepID=UPI00188FED1E|nr:hypothetical protein [Pararhodonellum marinum]
MTRTSLPLIQAFRRTIHKLKHGASYQWGHMGACNCGNLAQEITQLTKGEIHQYAMQRHGDWYDQILEYCPGSGYPIDLMISKMLEAGLSLEDLQHLERLTDPKILREIPKSRRDKMVKNNVEDVILYLETWLHLLEEEWTKMQDVSIDFETKELQLQS